MSRHDCGSGRIVEAERGFIQKGETKRTVKTNSPAYLAAALAAATAVPAWAVEVPGVTPADFGGEPAASAIWSILAGQGPWGVLLFGVIGLVWKFAKPYLDEWTAARRMEKLLAVVEMGVRSAAQTYVEAAKAAAMDGKLTAAEAKEARSRALDAAIAIGKAQGLDVVKEYGLEVVNWVIESAVSKLGVEAKIVKAVAGPLSASRQASALAPLPDSVS